MALAGLVITVSACFLPVPPVDADPSSSEGSSGAGSSSGEQPTSGGGESTSTGEVGSTSTGSTSEASTSEAEGSDGTTEFSLPTCPYDPPEAKVSLATSDDGELVLQDCGAVKKFDRLLLPSLGGTPLEFSVCSDAACGNCVANDQVVVGMSIPDPFDGFGGGVVEGGCYEVEVKWERPSTVEPPLCSISTVRIHRLVDGAPTPVPSMIYRLSGALDVVDEVGDFSLTAAAAGTGTITCPCDGDEDCCRETPGTRDVQFTVAIGDDEFMGEPLMAEQSQEVKFGDEVDAMAGISLVRSHFPSECAALAVHEWVFRHPSSF